MYNLSLPCIVFLRVFFDVASKNDVISFDEVDDDDQSANDIGFFLSADYLTFPTSYRMCPLHSDMPGSRQERTERISSQIWRKSVKNLRNKNINSVVFSIFCRFCPIPVIMQLQLV